MSVPSCAAPAADVIGNVAVAVVDDPLVLVAEVRVVVDALARGDAEGVGDLDDLALAATGRDPDDLAPGREHGCADGVVGDPGGGGAHLWLPGLRHSLAPEAALRVVADHGAVRQREPVVPASVDLVGGLLVVLG